MGQEVLDAFWKSNDRIYNENTLLYHRLARACGLPDCAFWLLYTLRSEEAPLTQTQLSEQLSLPKQTVNSALKKLVEEGVLRLEAADGNLKNKRVCLTEAGEAFLRRTVDRVFGVESAAAARLTEEERSALVALSQKLPYYDEYVKSGAYSAQDRFSNFDRPFYELEGKTWGIVGMGNIGRRAAAIATAFGCKVIFYSITGKSTCTDYPQVDKDTLLKESDFLSLHCPLSDLSRNFIDKEALRKMKKTAILINVARGPVVNNADLYEALVAGEIQAAGLDVLEKEPLELSNPLSQLKDSNKLIITPHLAWASVEARTRCVQGVYENIKAFMRGENRNVVNL